MKRITLSALLAAALLVGCNGPAAKGGGSPEKTPEGPPRERLSDVEKRLIGKWKGEPQNKETKKDAKTRDSAMFSPALAEQLGGYVLEIRDTGKFDLSMTGQQIEGEWILTGADLELKPAKILGVTKADAEAKKDELVLELFKAKYQVEVIEGGEWLEMAAEGKRPMVKFEK